MLFLVTLSWPQGKVTLKYVELGDRALLQERVIAKRCLTTHACYAIPYGLGWERSVRIRLRLRTSKEFQDE